MANHAHVVLESKPTIEEVDAVVRKVVAEKWWIESEVRNAVAKELGGRMYDDGVHVDGGEAPIEETFSTYREYQNFYHPEPEAAEFIGSEIVEERSISPESVRELYG